MNSCLDISAIDLELEMAARPKLRPASVVMAWAAVGIPAARLHIKAVHIVARCAICWEMERVQECAGCDRYLCEAHVFLDGKCMGCYVSPWIGSSL